MPLCTEYHRHTIQPLRIPSTYDGTKQVIAGLARRLCKRALRGRFVNVSLNELYRWQVVFVADRSDVFE